MTGGEPDVVFVLSGKRKSGKDFVAARLAETIGKERCALVHLSGPLKRQYAVENGLNYAELMTSGTYKELHRDKMIRWGESRREADPSFFCRAATSHLAAPVWIVVDARRRTDLDYFRRTFGRKVALVRVEASLEARERRGWKFVGGVDDAESECGLDHLARAGCADDVLVVDNSRDGDECRLDKQLALLLDKWLLVS